MNLFDDTRMIFTHPCVLLLIGGGVGANLRYWLGIAFHSRGWTAEFPWHTFAINVVGSLVLGFLTVSCKDRPAALLLLGTGVCGGFTTFSTFSVETVILLRKDRYFAACAYALGSVLAAIIGATIGLRMAKGA